MFYTEIMSKKAKKRTKRYHGEDAKRPQASQSSEPVVHRYEAVERSRLGEWWQPRKKLFRFGAIATGVTLGGGWLLVELFQLVF